MRRWMGVAAALVALAAAGAAQAQAARPPVSLVRIASSLRPGQPWASVGSGMSCGGRTSSEWSAETEQSLQGDVEFVALFDDELTKQGFRAAGGGEKDLFKSREEKGDLQVGALVTGLNIQACAPLGGMQGTYGIYSPKFNDMKGSATMDVEWQVFSVVQDKVIGRIRTHGVAEIKRPRSETGTALIRQAFADNAAQLARSPEFARLVDTAAAPMTPNTEVARGELSIAMPAAAKPVALAAAAASVVTIFAGNSMGSGVLVSREGYLLTNHHVAGDAGRVRIRWPDGTDTVGEVVRADRRRDVALIKTTLPAKATPLAIRHTPPQLGETVFAIGTPLEKELSGTLTRGVVSTVSRTYEGQPFIQSDVGVAHGNSGGPLLDERGAVLGLTDLGLHADETPNLNLFIPIDDALKALAVKPVA